MVTVKVAPSPSSTAPPTGALTESVGVASLSEDGHAPPSAMRALGRGVRQVQPEALVGFVQGIPAQRHEDRLQGLPGREAHVVRHRRVIDSRLRRTSTVSTSTVTVSVEGTVQDTLKMRCRALRHENVVDQDPMAPSSFRMVPVPAPSLITAFTALLRVTSKVSGTRPGVPRASSPAASRRSAPAGSRRARCAPIVHAIGRGVVARGISPPPRSPLRRRQVHREERHLALEHRIVAHRELRLRVVVHDRRQPQPIADHHPRGRVQVQQKTPIVPSQRCRRSHDIDGLREASPEVTVSVPLAPT